MEVVNAVLFGGVVSGLAHAWLGNISLTSDGAKI